MDELQLGNRIQALRTEQGLSLRTLAAKAGITASMLSQIENEQVNPSVNTLRSVAQALDIPLYALFKDQVTPNPVVRPQQRRIIGSRSEPDISYELLTADTKGALEFCMMVIPPECSSCANLLHHTGEEVAYMLSGDLVELDLDGSVYTLHPGDSVRIPPNTAHAWHNPGKATVQVIFAVTPPTF